MALAHAYFDESGTDVGAKDLCLAGYIFDSDSALAFDREWRLMLDAYKLPYFHMKEIAMRAGGIYGHLDEAQRDKAARRAIDLIKTHAAQGIAISVDKAVGGELRKGSLWKNPYSFIAGQVLFGVRGWAERAGFDGDVVYLFEAGARGWGDANEAAMRVQNEPTEFARSFRIASFSSALKERETPLQAADMLAWHWLKHNRRLREGVAQRRADFKELLKVPTDAHHYDRAAVDFLSAMRRQAAASSMGDGSLS